MQIVIFLLFQLNLNQMKIVESSKELAKYKKSYDLTLKQDKK